MEKCRSGKLNLPKNLHGNARELVKLLLTDDCESRLEIAQIKLHKFFKGINWRRIKDRDLEPPFVPETELPFNIGDIIDQKRKHDYQTDEISLNNISENHENDVNQ